MWDVNALTMTIMIINFKEMLAILPILYPGKKGQFLSWRFACFGGGGLPGGDCCPGGGGTGTWVWPQPFYIGPTASHLPTINMGRPFYRRKLDATYQCPHEPLNDWFRVARSRKLCRKLDATKLYPTEPFSSSHHAMFKPAASSAHVTSQWRTLVCLINI